MHLASLGQETEVRLPAPPGMGVASTVHAAPSHRAASGTSAFARRMLWSPTAMQLLPLVHQTPVNSVTDPPRSGLACTVQAAPSHVADRATIRPPLRKLPTAMHLLAAGHETAFSAPSCGMTSVAQEPPVQCSAKAWRSPAAS